MKSTGIGLPSLIRPFWAFCTFAEGPNSTWGGALVRKLALSKTGYFFTKAESVGVGVFSPIPKRLALHSDMSSMSCNEK